MNFGTPSLPATGGGIEDSAGGARKNRGREAGEERAGSRSSKKAEAFLSR